MTFFTRIAALLAAVVGLANATAQAQAAAEPPYSTIHFIRNGNFVGSACRTDLTLPNQREFPVSLGSVVHYKVYSEGEISITLDTQCPGANGFPGGSSARQVAVTTKRGEDHYVLCGPAKISEVTKTEAEPVLAKIKNEMRQTENLDLPINRASLGNVAAAPGAGQGTCFLISPAGYLITNYHCVENSKEISIKGIQDDFTTRYAATVVATDPSNDLALLKFSNKNLTFGPLPYQLRTTGVVQAERVYALGFPVASALGEELKVTDGIISARSGLHGDVSKFQMSAAVSPGNSGGPLVDEAGNVIGVVFAKSGVADAAGYAVKAMYLDTFLRNAEGFTYPSFPAASPQAPFAQRLTDLRKCVFIIETK